MKSTRPPLAQVWGFQEAMEIDPIYVPPNANGFLFTPTSAVDVAVFEGRLREGLQKSRALSNYGGVAHQGL